MLRQLKKILILWLVLSHSFTVCASVVSDYDGAAFTTKAEFEALKSSFNTQIETYNTSIDSKVDGMVAAYLDGLSVLKPRTITPFVEVSGSKPTIYSRQPQYEQISSQFWNDLTCCITSFGTAGGVAETYKPFKSKGTGGLSGGEYAYWVMKVQAARSPYKNMNGYQFNTDGVITGIYADDQIAINISDTECTDTWGSYDMGVLAHVAKSSFTSQTLETGRLYFNALTIPGNRWSQSLAGSQTGSTIISNYYQFLYDVDTDSRYSTSYAGKEESGTDCIVNTFYASHPQKSERKTWINIYNSLDAIIYAYPEGAKKLEVFADPLSSYDKHSNGKRWQLAMYTNDDNYRKAVLMGYSWWYSLDNTRLHRYGLYVPKLKLKNDTTITDLKPTYQASGDTAKKFNNLNQFKNGYMSYLDASGNVCYPKFYGGVPLFNFSSLTEKVSFKIKVNSTVSSSNKVRIWIKEGEFPNANYSATSSAWTATDPMTGTSHNNDLVGEYTVNGTKYTGKYVDIPSNTEVKIEFEDLKKNMPYFLRFAEVNTSGTCLNYGGRIVALKDFVAYSY